MDSGAGPGNGANASQRNSGRVWQGLAVGLLATIGATAVLLFLRLAFQAFMPIELIAQWVPTVTPVSAQADGIATFGEALKPLGFTLLLGGQLLLGTLWGLVVTIRRQRRRLTTRAHETWFLAGGLPTIAWLVLWLLLPAVQNRGLEFVTGLVGVATFSMVLVALQTTLGIPALTPTTAPAASPGQRQPRRPTFVQLAWSGVLVVAGIGLWQLLTRGFGSSMLTMGGGDGGRDARAPGMQSEITPIDDHYTVSKNFRDPTVDAADWKLEITGLVERPYTLKYDDIMAMTTREQIHTLICISNPVGGEYIGNARWEGLPLKTFLDTAGIGTGVRDIVVHAADNYSDSFPIEKVMDPGTMIVWKMNGEPLPTQHGFPIRLLLPDIYGMKNVKWITKIELVDHDYIGFWQKRSWSDIATVKTMSRIDVPENAARIAADTEHVIGGVAFAGPRGISKVEVSADEARTWMTADIRPPLSKYAWSLWTVRWQPEAGSYRLLVRATDGEGNVQPSEHTASLPDGADGWDQISINVVPKAQVRPQLPPIEGERAPLLPQMPREEGGR